MDKKDFYFLGKITKTSGYHGSLVFFFDVDDIRFYSGLEAIFVEINDELVPFAIKKLSIKGTNIAIATLEDITDSEQAKALTGQSLYLPLSYLPPLSGKKFYYHEVSGFSINDRRKGIIGQIDHVMDQSGQGIFVVHYQGKEILIPAADEIINKVDRKKKIIEVELPEGLLDIYL
jgi:16S rRNA processing protein RimM